MYGKSADDFGRFATAAVRLPYDLTMSSLFYQACRAGVKVVWWQTIRATILHADRAERPGGYLLACTHLSHLEPILVSGIVRRQVHWMARIEFYRRWWAATTLRLGGAFPVDRFGHSLPAVRRAIKLAKDGQCVGIFPEGGVAHSNQSVMRGAAFKEGVCTIAVEARVPVVPVVMLGTDRLNEVGPWLPFRRARIACAFGNEIWPRQRSESRRADRKEIAGRIGAEYLRLYQHLLAQPGTEGMDVS